MKTKLHITKAHLILTAVLAFGPLFAAGVATAQAIPASVDGLRNAAPYCFVGRLTFKVGTAAKQGSATVIKPYSLLTAAHCLWKPATGFNTNIKFERSYSKGTFASLAICRTPLLLGGYTGTQSFTNDMGFVICFSRPMNGWNATPVVNGLPVFMKPIMPTMSLGYGSEYHTGLEMLRSTPTQGYFAMPASWRWDPVFRYYQQVPSQWFKNLTYSIEGGMSGGPVFTMLGTTWYVAAVNVSKETGNRTSMAGVRNIDAEANNWIKILW